MLDKFLRRKALLVAKFAAKAQIAKRRPRLALVGQLESRALAAHRLKRSVKASARKNKPVVAVHAPVDDAGRVVDVQTKPLHLGIVRIHESRKADKLSAQRWRKLRLADVDCIRKRNDDPVGDVFVGQFVSRRFRRAGFGIEQRPRLVLQNIRV